VIIHWKSAAQLTIWGIKIINVSRFQDTDAIASSRRRYFYNIKIFVFFKFLPAIITLEKPG